MSIPKRVATATVGLGLVAGFIVGATPAHAYGPAAAEFGCRLYFGDAGTGSSPTTWNDTVTLTQSPANPSVGDTVTVTFTAAAGSSNGPVPLTAGTVPITVNVAIAGAQTGTVSLSHAAYPPADVAAYAPLGAISATGTYTATATGAASLTVTRVLQYNAQAATYCSAAGDRDHKAAPLATNIVENFSIFNPSVTISSVTGQTVTTHARANNVINFSVSGMAANASLTATLNNSSGGGTAEGAGTGSTDGTGAGTGTLTVPSGATAGARTLVVSDGASSKSVAITILTAPAISITPSGGGAGTSVAVTGTNFNPGSSVTVQGYAPIAGPPPPPATSDTPSVVAASATGTISTTFVVNDPTTVYIGAISGSLFTFQAWAASADSCVAPASGSCELSYNLSQTITGGNLGMLRAAGSSTITFTPITLDGNDQQSTGSLSAITVKDYRGSTFGWSLTAAVTDFAGTPSGTIAKSNLAWAPSCVDTPGAVNAVAAVAGSAGPVDGATLCSAPADAAGTGGSFDASADLTLSVPATQLAGTYAATLIITLS